MFRCGGARRACPRGRKGRQARPDPGRAERTIRRLHALRVPAAHGPQAPDPRPPGRRRAPARRRSPLRRGAGDLRRRSLVGAPDPDTIVLDRTPLHAAALRIPHPSGRGWLWVESPLPDDMARCWICSGRRGGPATSDLSGSVRGAGTGAAARDLLSVHQRLHVGLEGDLDLVPADLLHQSDPEQRVLDHLLGGVLVPRRVAPGAREPFPRAALPNWSPTVLPPGVRGLRAVPHDPSAVPSRHRRGSCARPGRCCTGPAPACRRPPRGWCDPGSSCNACHHASMSAPTFEAVMEWRNLDHNAAQVRADSRDDLIIDGLGQTAS